MNIYIEYYKFSDDRKNNHAQMKEQAKWVPPDPSIVHKRFCQSRKEAQQLAKVCLRMVITLQSKQTGV